MQFRFVRTNTSSADTGVLSIYNLPRPFRDAIRSGFEDANDDRARFLGPESRFRNDPDGRNAALQALAFANRIRIFAGYKDDEKLIFQGDISDLKARSIRSGIDTITEIALGDSILTYKYGYLTKTFGAGSSLKDIIVGVVRASGAKVSDQALAFMDVTNLPGVVGLEFVNGAHISGGVQYNLDNLIEAYGVQWFMQNDEVFFMPRGAVLEDFSIRLDEGRNMLRPIGLIDGEDLQFRMLIDGDMVPGRGFRIFNDEGKPTARHGYRADTIEYRGDTHGNSWYNTVTASRISADLFVPFTKIAPSEAFEVAGVAS